MEPCPYEENMEEKSKEILPSKQKDLSLRRLKVIPSDVLVDTTILTLNLDRNKLKGVSGINRLQELRVLILSKNELTDFPMEIQSLIHLEKLELNQNKIQTIPTGIFLNLKDLKHLKLNNNRILQLPTDLGSCSKLQYLNLSHNLFIDFPDCILKIKSLKEVYLENNKLQKLPVELFLDMSLKKFKASCNHLREPPDEVCVGGLKQIRSYFLQLQETQGREEKRVKVIFIGASLAGKTTISRSLTQGHVVPVSLKERTVGIEISEFHIKDLTFLFWDFAGHLEYYGTHHVFITPYALVILVVNLHRYQVADEQNFTDLVGFWIKNLVMRVPNSVVMMVGTHTDLCQPGQMEEKSKDIDEKITRMLDEHKANLNHFINNLEERQDSELYLEQADKLRELSNCTVHILKVFPIRGIHYNDIEKLQNHILNTVCKEELFPNIIKMLPPIYKIVENAILEVKQNEETPQHGMMDLDHLLNEVMLKTNRDLDKNLLKDILRYLHRIGLIVWYEDIKQLLNTVFLKPAFLIAVFKMLVRHDLYDQLGAIPAEVLISERAFKRDVLKWQETLQSKAMIRFQAIRVLVKHQLQTLCLQDSEDLFHDLIGHGSQNGKLLSLLMHFQICMSVRNMKKLNPNALEFVPGNTWFVKDSQKELCYLFPTYLNNFMEVAERWGGDHHDDIHIRMYLSPRIPEGFFQRLMVKSCSFYSTHWVEKDNFLLVNNGKPLLIKQFNQWADSYLEMRSRKPKGTNDFQSLWDFMLTILSIAERLCKEWPGLFYYIRSPCRTIGCPDELEWPDMERTGFIYNMIKEDFMTCETCCNTVNMELLFPKASGHSKDPCLPPTIHVTNYGIASIVSHQ
ncbi:malignant fibrous histiocytoma-amplified sequence 1 homolog [Hyla sarda]|uniref:malignant fibrous histiocytoma-amplified sequence 1 homolog n=1 Tax=Hyla sarda TaxID=327740 RepID=UPI0024C42F5A|nr:malignant fibrous histiocytoma-amplified sequence 1 homolog [Hyla sarda]